MPRTAAAPAMPRRRVPVASLLVDIQVSCDVCRGPVRVSRLRLRAADTTDTVGRSTGFNSFLDSIQKISATPPPKRYLDTVDDLRCDLGTPKDGRVARPAIAQRCP